jgi:hypothetical protein
MGVMGGGAGGGQVGGGGSEGDCLVQQPSQMLVAAVPVCG